MALEEPDDINELLPFMDNAEEEIDVEPMETTFPECVAVDNLPVVDEAKKPKLASVLNKIFTQVGKIVKLEMPMGPDGKSFGFAFIEFETKKSATDAIDRVNGYKLDKNHVFKVMAYPELGRLATLPPTYVEPADPEFMPQADLKSWLSDPAARDQYVIRHAAFGREETTVSWCESGRNPAVAYGGEREKESGLVWCEMEVKWSAKGSYLGTFHKRGVALWGGPSMEKQGRFAHDGVNRLSFSPCERFMLTCNFRNPNEGESTVLFWDIKAGTVLRQFPLSFSRVGDPGMEERSVPNLFKWSHDGSYVAHMATTDPCEPRNNVIKIYAVPSMQLLDSKSLRANGVMDFLWSPSDNTLAYWAAEKGDTPARVCLVAIPSRTEVRQKNLFSVSDCALAWHPAGDFLSVRVVRHTKSKKTLFNNLELFRIREELVPVETLDLKQMVKLVAWEPHGTRFALHLTGDPSDPKVRPSVVFYEMSGGTAKKEVTLLKSLENRAVSHLSWSPVGGHIVLAALPIANVNDFQGVLEFYDVDALADKGLEVNHYRANAIEWDPSGRMLATAVTQPLEGMVYKYQMDNGYKLWTFQGENFFEKQSEKFYSFSWRPRPASLLSPEQTKSVIKNLRKFERKFERADREEKRKREHRRLRELQMMREDFRDRLAARKARNYDSIRAEKAAARGGFDVDDDANYVIDTVVREVVVSQKEDIMML